MPRRPPVVPLMVQGFTLIEVLVAMVVMALLAVMAWQGVDAIVRSRDISGARLEQTLRLNTALAQWEQDLNAVQDSGVVPPLVFDGARLRLTRRAPGGLHVVVWALAADSAAGGTSRWLRWAGPVARRRGELQAQWLRSQQLAANDVGQLAVLSGLAQWQVYCFRGNDNTWSNCQSSNDLAAPAASAASGASAPTAPRQALPTGVRSVISFAPAGVSTGVLTRDVALGPQWP